MPISPRLSGYSRVSPTISRNTACKFPEPMPCLTVQPESSRRNLYSRLAMSTIGVIRSWRGNDAHVAFRRPFKSIGMKRFAVSCDALKIVHGSLQLGVVGGRDQFRLNRMREVPHFRRPNRLRRFYGFAALNRSRIPDGAEVVGFAESHGVGYFLILRQSDGDVGAESDTLNRSAMGRVIERRREAKRPAALYRNDALHRAFPETARAHQLRPMVVLQRTGDDFGGRGGSAVDQHHHRHSLDPVSRPRRREGVVVALFAAAG